MIPEDHKDEIIRTGIDFMTAITNAYGSDEGMKLYDSIMSQVDPDIKGQIFFAMITGDTQSKINLKGVHLTIGNKIDRIRAIRQVSDYGLKEAKDVVDAVEVSNRVSIPFQKNKVAYKGALEILIQAGFVV